MSAIRCSMVLIGAVSVFAWSVPASALTFEQAMAQCRRQFGHLGDTEGAPKQQQAIEGCAQQKMQQQGSQPKRK